MNVGLVLGVGPDRGMGAQLCKRFASQGLHVVVSGRTKDKLECVVSAIEKEGGSANSIVADATIENEVKELFSRAEEKGNIDLAVYNAGNNIPGSLQEMTAQYFEDAWRVCCYGGFLFGREAARIMTSRGSGTIIFTGASASLRGRAGFGAFNSSKAGLRGFAQALTKECGPQGIHVGHVVIDGAINDEKVTKRYPEFVKKVGNDRLIQVESIVDAYEFLWKQLVTGWSFEVDVRTASEPW